MAVASVTDWQMIIDGEHVGSGSGEWTEVRSPATGDLAGRVPAGTVADVDHAAAGRASFEEYTRVRHVMVELTGVAEKDWHYQVFGDAPEGE